MAPILVELYKRSPFFGLGLGLGLIGSGSSASSSSTNNGSSSSSSSSSTEGSSGSQGLVYNGTNTTNSSSVSSGSRSTGGASHSTSLDWIPLTIGVVMGLPLLLSVCMIAYNCCHERKERRKRKREDPDPAVPVPPGEYAAKVFDEAVFSYNSSQQFIYNPPAYPPNTYQL